MGSGANVGQPVTVQSWTFDEDGNMTARREIISNSADAAPETDKDEATSEKALIPD